MNWGGWQGPFHGAYCPAAARSSALTDLKGRAPLALMLLQVTQGLMRFSTSPPRLEIIGLMYCKKGVHWRAHRQPVQSRTMTLCVRPPAPQHRLDGGHMSMHSADIA